MPNISNKPYFFIIFFVWIAKLDIISLTTKQMSNYFPLPGETLLNLSAFMQGLRAFCV